jgi:hypothetical protein
MLNYFYNKSKINEIKIYLSVLKIQSLFRGFLTRKIYKNLLKQNECNYATIPSNINKCNYATTSSNINELEISIETFMNNRKKIFSNLLTKY